MVEEMDNDDIARSTKRPAYISNFDPIVDGALLLSLRHFDPRPQRGFEGGGDAQALPAHVPTGMIS